MEFDKTVFQKVMIAQDGPNAWVAALCRTGFENQEDAMRWVLEYMNPQSNKNEIDDVYREAIEDAFGERE